MTKKKQEDAISDVALDDIMIAMDVVDTLRHDKRIVDRELNDDKRRSDLIKRLKELYKSQGIDVPDHVLEEGVQALEDERFVYKPPEDNFQTRLAKIYVSRESWGKRLFTGLGVFFGIWLMWHFFFQAPENRRAQETHIELTQTLPNSIKRLMKDISSESQNPAITNTSQKRSETGLRAATAKNLAEAKNVEKELQETLKNLRQEYTIKIVTRKGVQSGIWRIPKVNRKARNYYLVVEAIDKKGKILPQTILNEETDKRETVKLWGVRVSKTVFDTVKADKQDDGIIQNNIVAVKKRGYIKPQFRIQTSGRTITRW